MQCELCGRWYHYRCGSGKIQVGKRENWNGVGMKGENAKRGAAKWDVTNYELKARHREL